MKADSPSRVVHLELHTGNLAQAQTLYAELCGWRSERIEAASGSYLALELGASGSGGPELGGGIVECETRRPVWLPYVEVPDVGEATRRAVAMGARVLLDRREGPAGWRSVIATRAGAELAFWQSKQ